MRLYYFLLVVVAILASVNSSDVADTKVINPVFSSMRHSLVAEKINTKTSTGKYDEERMFDINFRYIVSPQLQRWLKTGKSIDDVFKLLKLDEAGTMILSNRNLKRWAAFVAKKTGTSPEETMITKLRTQYDDEFLAQLLLAEEKGSSKEMVTKLQNALFNKWHEERKMPALKVRNEVWIPAGPVSVTYMKFLKKKGLTFGRESNRRIRTQHPPAF